MDTIKLLIADDLSIVRQGVKHIFKNQKDINVVAEANSCNEITEYLNNNPDSIDILLMDVEFAESCGIEATKTILGINERIKVIILTSQKTEATIVRMIKSGVLGYVLKEEAHELIDAVKEVVTGNKYYSKKVSAIMISALMDNENSKDVNLSEREIQVLNHIANGETNKVAGNILNISSRTIETHRRNIVEKLGVRNTAEMIRYAMSHQLIA